MTGIDPGGPAHDITLRRVTASDSDLILEWANDPVTRASSFHPGPIAAADHSRWFAARLADPATAFWIGEQDGRPIGQVRIESESERESGGTPSSTPSSARTAEVSISVAPGYRGRGSGRALLLAAIATVRDVLPVAALRARVRTDNPASLALFAAAGFRELGRDICDGVPCAQFELRVA